MGKRKGNGGESYYGQDDGVLCEMPPNAFLENLSEAIVLDKNLKSLIFNTKSSQQNTAA